MTFVGFEDLRDLIENYKLEVKGDGFKCSICKRVLIDAQIAPCACRYCRSCISKVLERGGSTCPGRTDECRQKDLTEGNILAVDYLMNRSISTFIVKCPELNCQHQCQLRHLKEHLRVCEHKLRHCPFHELGCDTVNIPKCEMTDHLNSEMEIHGKLVVNLINNLTNEIRRLEENHRREMENMRLHLDREAESLRNERSPAREEDQSMMDTCQNLQDEVEQLKMENRDLKEQIMKHEVDLKLAKLKQVNEMGVLVWEINNISEKRSRRYVSSNYIYSSNGDKMVLKFFPNGFRRQNDDVHSSLKLCMSKFQCNQTTSFYGRVIMRYTTSKLETCPIP